VISARGSWPLLCLLSNNGRRASRTPAPEVVPPPAGPESDEASTSMHSRSREHSSSHRLPLLQGLFLPVAVYKRFISTLASPAFLASNGWDLSVHRGQVETMQADEGGRQDSDPQTHLSLWSMPSAAGVTASVTMKERVFPISRFPAVGHATSHCRSSPARSVLSTRGRGGNTDQHQRGRVRIAMCAAVHHLRVPTRS
jgi:hypothetical protein